MVIPYSMKRPIFVRPLSDAERKTLEAGLRSPDAFTLRRSARYCSLATGAKTPTRSLTSWAAIRKRRATPSTLSTRRGSRKRFSRVRSIRILFTGLSTLSKLMLCGSCFTKTLANSANRVAFGLWRWPPRSASKKGSPKSGSRARPSGQRWRGWGSAGSGPIGRTVPLHPQRAAEDSRPDGFFSPPSDT
jgi:hypothetical protein